MFDILLHVLLSFFIYNFFISILENDIPLPGRVIALFTGKGLHALLHVGRQMYVDDVILQGGHGVGVVERLVALVAEQFPPLPLVMVGLVGRCLFNGQNAQRMAHTTEIKVLSVLDIAVSVIIRLNPNSIGGW